MDLPYNTKCKQLYRSCVISISATTAWCEAKVFYMFNTTESNATKKTDKIADMQSTFTKHVSGIWITITIGFALCVPW
jgi:hypothetical protein